MKATAQMGGLTKAQVDSMRAFLNSAASIGPALMLPHEAIDALCDLALQAIDREALRVPVREIMFEALEKLERALQPPPTGAPMTEEQKESKS